MTLFLFFTAWAVTRVIKSEPAVTVIVGILWVLAALMEFGVIRSGHAG